MSCDPGIIAKTQGFRIRSAPVDPPLVYQPGDFIECEQGTIWLKRDGFYVDSREIGPAVTAEPQPMQSAGFVDQVSWQEKVMLIPVSTSLANVDQPTPGNFSFTDQNGSGTPALTLEQCAAYADKYQANPDIHMEILIANWFLNGGPDNPDALNGSQVVMNFQATTKLLLDEGN